MLVVKVYAAPKYPLKPLGQLATFIQYGISERATEEKIGVPMLRMNNLQADGWDLTDLKYIQLGEEDLERYQLHSGDLLFNRTNSKELVGKCEVFRESGAWVFASYLIRVRLNAEVIPEFVSTFLNAPAGRAQIDRVSRHIVGMANVNAEELRELQIPLPNPGEQRRLMAVVEKARAARQRKLTEADALLTSLDSWLLEQLGLAPTAAVPRRVFAIRLKQVRGRRLDAPAYQPFYQAGVRPQTPIRKLGELATVDSNTAVPPENDSELVPYVGLPECDQTEIREVVLRPYSEVKGRSVVRPGDILFARIEPSVFNQKYVLAENLKGHDYAYTSTEFYVVRAKSGVEQAYLYAMMFCSFVFAQVKGKTTGSSGRRRIDSDLFAELQIPLPSEAKQKAISAEVVWRRETARRLRSEAASEWATAKAWFESELLGRPATPERNS